MTKGPFASLSVTECHILREVTDGKTNKQIGVILKIPWGTVRNHVSAMMEKLSLPNRAALAAYAITHRLKDLKYWEKQADPDLPRRVARMLNHMRPPC